MNPDAPKSLREELESRVTALLLGELPPDEATLLREIIAHDVELTKLHDQLKQTIALVRETVRSEAEVHPPAAQPLQLSAARRKRLQTAFLIPPLQAELKPKSRAGLRLIELLAVLSIVAILAAMLLPALSKSKAKAQRVTVQNNLKQLDVAKQLWAEAHDKSPEAAPTLDELKPYLGRGEMPSVGGETYVPGKVGEPAAAAEAKKTFGQLPGKLPAGESGNRVRLLVDGKVSVVDQNTVTVSAGITKSEAEQMAGLLQRTRRGEVVPAMTPNEVPKAGTTIVLPALESADPHFVIGGVARDDEGISSETTLAADRTFDRLNSGFAGSGEEKRMPASGPLPVMPPESTAPIPSGVQSDADGGTGGVEDVRLDDSSLGLKGRGQATGKPGRPVTAMNPATGLPVNLGKAEAAPAQQLETRAYAVPAEVFHRYLNEGDEMAANGVTTPSAPAIGKDHFVIPRVSVSGFSGGGGGGAPQTPASTPLVEGEIPVRYANPENFALAVGDAAKEARVKSESNSDRTRRILGVELNADADKSVVVNERTDVLQEGTLTTISGRSSNVPVLGDLPVIGRLAGSSDRNAVAPTNLVVPEGGRIVPEPNVYSVDAVGYAPVPIQSTDSAAVTSNEAGRRETPSIELQGFTDPSMRPSAPIPIYAKNTGNEYLLAGGLRRKETLPAKADAPAGQTEEFQKNRTYEAKKRELQALADYDQLLKRKLAIEEIDLSLPKSSQVPIIEYAQAKSESDRGVLSSLRRAFSGNVERVARIKMEHDKSDIDGLSGRASSAYDPYFVQTEMETVQSEAVLGKVVDQLKLDEAWARQKGSGTKLDKKEAVALLRERLKVRSVPNTTLVDIQAESAKPEEAASIANAVAAAYQEWRQTSRQRLAGGSIEDLKKQAAQQEEQIQSTKLELDQLRRELNLSATEATAVLDVAAIRKPATNAPIPQPEVLTSENNFSTFSLNVSDVSFKLAAASLEQGQMPDAASVRSEEFINAFDYRDPEPAADAPIAFAWERARYPFAHNRDLLRFSLKTAAAGRQAGRPLNIVLLLDNSGSMERADRVRIIHEALRVLAAQLQPQDKLSVITFARTARLVADGISGDKAGEVAEQVSGLMPQGGTNLEDAMNLAYQTAAKHYLANGINRVVLLTDGAANLGDVEPDSLKQKVEAQRQQGIALDCFGIGWDGLNDDLLEVLARNGDGRYGFINSPEEAATDFVGQLAGALKVAASDVKVQVEFNPQRVTSYRQIGYAKHQLTKEQFRDNTVDAAEIAAQEAGNALYTVEVNPAGSGPLGTVRVRYKIPGTTTYREQAWDVPYTGNALTLDQSSPAMRLAATAGAFSEWLVASPFAGEVAPDALLGYLRGVPEVFGADSRPKKLEWMIRQAKSIEGK